jgi:hypothetical protein
VLARRCGTAKPGLLSEARYCFFAANYRKSQEIHWPHRHYRHLFLGPLPHILFCLNVVETRTHELKRKAKERLKKERHQELEQLGEQLTQFR